MRQMKNGGARQAANFVASQRQCDGKPVIPPGQSHAERIWVARQFLCRGVIEEEIIEAGVVAVKRAAGERFCIAALAGDDAFSRDELLQVAPGGGWLKQDVAVHDSQHARGLAMQRGQNIRNKRGLAPKQRAGIALRGNELDLGVARSQRRDFIGSVQRDDPEAACDPGLHAQPVVILHRAPGIGAQQFRRKRRRHDDMSSWNSSACHQRSPRTCTAANLSRYKMRHPGNRSRVALKRFCALSRVQPIR